MTSRVGRAAFWAIAGSGFQNFTSFALLLYLAHVLSPRDFGLMATVTVGLDLGLHVARWGQVELLQQTRFRDEAARTQSLLTSVVVAAAFTALFAVIAAPLGAHYKSPELVTMFYLCAPIFLLSAPRSTAEGILRSEFRFRLIAIRNNATTLVGAVVAIMFAMRGYGALALAVQRLIQAAMSAVWIWSAVAWRPRLSHFRYSPALVGEGARVMAGTVLPLLVPRTIDLLVGFLLGPAQLGLLRIAYRINDFVGQAVVMPLVGVANAELGGLSHDPGAMRHAYLRLTQASAGLMCPVLIGLALVAPEAVPILFGPQWHDSVPLVQIVSLLALVAPLNYYFMPAMVAVGQSRMVLRQGLFQALVGVVLAAGAAMISLKAVVIAHVVRGLLISVYNIMDLRRFMGLPYHMLARSMAPPIVATGVMALAVVSVRAMLGNDWSPFATLVALVAVGIATFPCGIWLGTHFGLWPDPLPHRLKALLSSRGRRAAARPPRQ